MKKEITIDEVMNMKTPSENFYVELKDNILGIRFKGFKLRDVKTNEIFHSYQSENIYELDYFADKGYSLGQASLNINEGLPLYIIEQIKNSFDLESSTVGILGMTFKAGVDDFRSSLSFRLRDELLKVSRKVLCSDPILQKNYFVSINEVTENCDIIIVATPHLEYAKLEFHQPTVDIWRITSTKSLF